MAYEGIVGPGASLAAMGIAVAIISIVVILAFYVYFALAWSTIARKLKYSKPWLAWIPIANLFLLPILAKKDWTWGFIFLVPVANAVFMIIWTWNIYEQRKYPGWLSLAPLLGIIPLVNFLAGIAQLVIIGLVAWADR